MKLRFLAVIPRAVELEGHHARIACIVEDPHLGVVVVRFRDRTGWTCQCPEDGETCAHVDVVDDAIDDKLFVP